MIARGGLPRALRELRIWMAAGESLVGGLAEVCEVEVIRPDTWEADARGAPAFLLVETADPWADRQKQLDALLSHCAQTGIPSLLWITASPLAPHWLDRCRRFDRVFTVDRSQLPELEAAGAKSPAKLWPGVRTPPEIPEAHGKASQRESVVWLGGWRADWPAPWRERLAAVLRGSAEYGLSIVEVADLDSLPSDLKTYIRVAQPFETTNDLIRRARVVVGADPIFGAPSLAPPVVLEAAASAIAVITPHTFLSRHDFMVGGIGDAPWRNLVPVVRDDRMAADELDNLQDDELYDEVVDHLHRIVVNNHTWAHRLATLSSTVGVRLAPDAQSPTPA